MQLVLWSIIQSSRPWSPWFLFLKTSMLQPHTCASCQPAHAGVLNSWSVIGGFEWRGDWSRLLEIKFSLPITDVLKWHKCPRVVFYYFYHSPFKKKPKKNQDNSAWPHHIWNTHCHIEPSHNANSMEPHIDKAKFPRILNQNQNMNENAFENLVCKMFAIFFRSQCGSKQALCLIHQWVSCVTHWGLVMHRCVNKLGHHWFR